MYERLGGADVDSRLGQAAEGIGSLPAGPYHLAAEAMRLLLGWKLLEEPSIQSGKPFLSCQSQCHWIERKRSVGAIKMQEDVTCAVNA
jgi:hypothetical protein